jgi:hypothetical protein
MSRSGFGLLSSYWGDCLGSKFAFFAARQPGTLHSGWLTVIARLIKVHRGSRTVDSARIAKLSHPELRNFLSDSAFE